MFFSIPLRLTFILFVSSSFVSKIILLVNVPSIVAITIQPSEEFYEESNTGQFLNRHYDTYMYSGEKFIEFLIVVDVNIGLFFRFSDIVYRIKSSSGSNCSSYFA